MTIKAASYQLCKSVIRSEQRAAVQAVFNSLNTGDRGSFGYHACTMRVQFAGFLVLNRDRHGLPALPPLPTPSEDELRTLTLAHTSIALIDAACLETVDNARLPLHLLMNPYTRFGIPSVPLDPADRIISPHDSANVVAQFQTHPALAIATQTLARIQDDIQHEPLLNAVDAIEGLLLSSGPMSCPPQIESVAFASPQDSNQRLVYRLISALLAVRTSLSVLNELLYQAFLINRLPVISPDTIVAFNPLTSNLAGWGISLITTPEPLSIPSDPQLFLLRVPDEGMPPIDLCRIESQTLNIASQFGDTVELSARALDDHLNPYAPLLRHL